MTLVEKSRVVLEKIEVDPTGVSMTGEDANNLFSEKKYLREREILAATDCIKEDFVKGLERVREFNVGGLLASYGERVKRSQKLYKEGIALGNVKKYKEGV